MNIDDFSDMVNLTTVNRVTIDRFKDMIRDNLGQELDDNQIILFMLTYYAMRAVSGQDHDVAMIGAFQLCREDAAAVEDDMRAAGSM